MLNQDKLRDLVAILPKESRMNAVIDALVRKAGFEGDREKPRQCYALTFDTQDKLPPFEIRYNRATRGMEAVAAGRADLIITGSDRIREFNAAATNRGEEAPLSIISTFNDIAACTLVIAAPPQTRIKTPQDLEGMRLGTSYPETLKRWLAQNDVRNVQVLTFDGDVEDTIRTGETDAIFDVVETGNSLRDNGLCKKLSVYRNTAVLAVNAASAQPDPQSFCAGFAARLNQRALTLAA